VKMAKIKREVKIEIENGKECKFLPEINTIVCKVDVDDLPIKIELPDELFKEISKDLSAYNEETRKAILHEIERVVKIYKRG